jgi:hypothetical protein
MNRSGTTEPPNLPGMKLIQHRDLDAKQARAITDSIKTSVGDLMILVAKAWQGRVWIALGYGSWPDYVKGEFNHAPLWLPPGERKAVVALLHGQGMSTRAIGAAAGVSDGTVRNDLAGAQNYAPESGPVPITGVDGKTYNPPAPSRPRRGPITDSFATASYQLGKSVERVARLTGDDRFNKNKDRITGANLGDLIRARDTLTGIIRQLEGSPANPPANPSPSQLTRIANQ